MSTNGSTQRFTVLLEWDPADHVWVSYVPTLGHLSTYGDTREQALQKTEEAIKGYIEAAQLTGVSLPDPQLPPEVIELEVSAN